MKFCEKIDYAANIVQTSFDIAQIYEKKILGRGGNVRKNILFHKEIFKK